jgi:hypothetical protein
VCRLQSQLDDGTFLQLDDLDHDSRGADRD